MPRATRAASAVILAVGLYGLALATAGGAAASPVTAAGPAAQVFESSACTTHHIPRQGTTVVTVRGTRVIRVPVRRHGHLAWARRRVRYRHRKRVVYTFRVPARHCPLPAPTASLAASTSPLPSTGGPVTLTYSSTNASTCTLTSSPALWAGQNPTSVGRSGSSQGAVPSAAALSRPGPSPSRRAAQAVSRRRPSRRSPSRLRRCPRPPRRSRPSVVGAWAALLSAAALLAAAS